MRLYQSNHLKDAWRQPATRVGLAGPAPMRPSVIGLFPSGVSGAELTDLSERFPLWSGETEAVSQASASRALEFAAGRHCARGALDLLGHAPVSIPRLPTNAPAWPTGITGSLSHSAGYCGAVVTRSRQFGAIGFDVERRECFTGGAVGDRVQFGNRDAAPRVWSLHR